MGVSRWATPVLKNGKKKPAASRVFRERQGAILRTAAPVGLRCMLTQEEQKRFVGRRLLEAGYDKEAPMPGDNIKVATREPLSSVAADLEYEIRYFAGKYDLSQEYVRDLIARVGNDPDEIDRVAQELRVAASTL
jgi:hypothetical protein